MKPRFLTIALVASLGANVLLYALSVSHANSRFSAAEGDKSATTDSGSGADKGKEKSKGLVDDFVEGFKQGRDDAAGLGSPDKKARPVLWEVGSSEESLRGFADRLRAAGFPPSVVRGIIRERIRERLEAANESADAPYWQRNKRSKEQLASAQEQNREARAELERVLGEDGTVAAMMSAKDKARRFGSLADDKINALAKIERDYAEMRNSISSGSTLDTEEFQANQEKRALLEKERLADMASLLSPAELEAYQMRTSDTAHKVMRNSADMNLSEAEYTALYRIQKSFDEATPRMPGQSNTADLQAQRLAAQNARDEQIRAQLGDQRLYQYLSETDPNYRRATKTFANFPEVSAAASYQVYQLHNEVLAAVMQASKTRTMPDMSSYNQRLESIVGPAAANAYRSTGNGRLFTFGNNNGAKTTRSTTVNGVTTTTTTSNGVTTTTTTGSSPKP